MRGFPDIKTIVEQKFTSVLKELEGTQFMNQLPYEVSSCITAMDKYCTRIEVKEKVNEAAVRTVYANAMIYMMCTLNNYFFRVEHRMTQDDQSNDDECSDLHQSISEGSTADYICYSVHDGR